MIEMISKMKERAQSIKVPFKTPIKDLSLTKAISNTYDSRLSNTSSQLSPFSQTDTPGSSNKKKSLTEMKPDFWRFEIDQIMPDNVSDLERSSVMRSSVMTVDFDIAGNQIAVKKDDKVLANHLKKMKKNKSNLIQLKQSYEKSLATKTDKSYQNFQKIVQKLSKLMLKYHKEYMQAEDHFKKMTGKLYPNDLSKSSVESQSFFEIINEVKFFEQVWKCYVAALHATSGEVTEEELDKFFSDAQLFHKRVFETCEIVEKFYLQKLNLWANLAKDLSFNEFKPENLKTNSINLSQNESENRKDYIQRLNNWTLEERQIIKQFLEEMTKKRNELVEFCITSEEQNIGSPEIYQKLNEIMPEWFETFNKAKQRFLRYLTQLYPDKIQIEQRTNFFGIKEFFSVLDEVKFFELAVNISTIWYHKYVSSMTTLDCKVDFFDKIDELFNKIYVDQTISQCFYDKTISLLHNQNQSLRKETQEEQHAKLSIFNKKPLNGFEDLNFETFYPHSLNLTNSIEDDQKIANFINEKKIKEHHISRLAYFLNSMRDIRNKFLFFRKELEKGSALNDNENIMISWFNKEIDQAGNEYSEAMDIIDLMQERLYPDGNAIASEELFVGFQHFFGIFNEIEFYGKMVEVQAEYFMDTYIDGDEVILVDKQIKNFFNEIFVENVVVNRFCAKEKRIHQRNQEIKYFFLDQIFLERLKTKKMWQKNF